MEAFPNAWIFFIIFIFITTFVMINLIVAVIVDAMNKLKDDEEEHIIEEIHTNHTLSHKDIEELKNELAEIKLLLQKK